MKNYSQIYKLLIILSIINIYLELPLVFLSGFYIPGFYILLLFILNFFIIKKYIKIIDYKFLIVNFLFLLINITISPGINYIGHKIAGFMQIIFSISNGVILSILISRVKRKDLRKIFYVLLIGMVIGVAFERFGILKDLSDIFRHNFYENGPYGIYEQNDRDIELVGFIRPKFFTSEPSLVGLGYFLLVSCYCLLSNRKADIYHCVLLSCLMLTLTGSPTLILSLIYLFFIFIINNKTSNLIKILVFTVPFLIILFYLDGYLINMLMSRLDGFSFDDEITSENMRLVFPFITLKDVLDNYPFWGIGISGFENLDKILSLKMDYMIAFGNNNIASLFIFFGLIGGIFFIYNFYKYFYFYIYKKYLLLMVLSIIMISTMMGGFQSPRLWGYIFIFFGVFKVLSLDKLRN